MVVTFWLYLRGAKGLCKCLGSRSFSAMGGLELLLLVILWGHVPGPGVTYRSMRQVILFNKYECPCKHRKQPELGHKQFSFEWQLFEEVFYQHWECQLLAPVDFLGQYDLYNPSPVGTELPVSASALWDNIKRESGRPGPSTDIPVVFPPLAITWNLNRQLACWPVTQRESVICSKKPNLGR